MPNSAIVICSSCGTKNRIPVARIGESPVCGQCKSPLNTAAVTTAPVIVTDQTFDREVMAHNTGVVMDCWAPWCGHCKSMDPVLTALALAYAGRIKVVKLNVDENPATTSRFRVMSLPSLLFFKDGKVVDTTVGALSRHEVETHLKALL
ncbi:MAG: thioredoxin [Desulfobacterium sp.]|nr:thioredoxin [Desulfobacterium sp.]